LKGHQRIGVGGRCKACRVKTISEEEKVRARGVKALVA